MGPRLLSLGPNATAGELLTYPYPYPYEERSLARLGPERFLRWARAGARSRTAT